MFFDILYKNKSSIIKKNNFVLTEFFKECKENFQGKCKELNLVGALEKKHVHDCVATLYEK